MVINMEKEIVKILEKLRPFLRNDGGDVEFVKYENNIVYVRFLGACSNCPMKNATLKDGIKMSLMEEMPEIKDVVLAQ